MPTNAVASACRVVQVREDRIRYGLCGHIRQSTSTLYMVMGRTLTLVVGASIGVLTFGCGNFSADFDESQSYVAPRFITVTPTPTTVPTPSNPLGTLLRTRRAITGAGIAFDTNKGACSIDAIDIPLKSAQELIESTDPAFVQSELVKLLQDAPIRSISSNDEDFKVYSQLMILILGLADVSEQQEFRKYINECLEAD
jgi:hypothetical protein